MPENSESVVYEIANQYVLAYAALDPIAATDAGIAGHVLQSAILAATG